MAAKAAMSGFGAIKGNGVKIPAFNQYRGHRDSYPLAKASHWGDLRRQGRESFEVRVGRTAVVDGIFAKNGYGDVRFVHTIAFFLSYTDIQLKTLSRRIEVFNMKIIMRRDSVIFYPENHRIDSAVRRCLSNRN